MPLDIEYSIEIEGTTVPYAPLFNSINRNFGFVDLRGKPDAAGTVPEVDASLGLKRLLMALAQPDHPVFSLGCDLGEHRERKSPLGSGPGCGGYVQFIAAKYERAPPKGYQAFARAAARAIEGRSAAFFWEIKYSLKGVCLKFYTHRDHILPIGLGVVLRLR